MENFKTSNTQQIAFENEKNIELYIRREDLIHPFISGNKYRKLKYNIKKAQQLKKDTLLTFGGAFSNHITATAYAGKLYDLNTIGVIRGEEIAFKIKDNPTLQVAESCGMQFHFIKREDYRLKFEPEFIQKLHSRFGEFYLVPEGGTNTLAITGCNEILSLEDAIYNYICCRIGTGGPISGLINT